MNDNNTEQKKFDNKNNNPNDPMEQAFGDNMIVTAKAKDFKKTWIRIFKFCDPYKWQIIISILLAVIGTIFSIIGPDQLSAMTDKIIQGMLTGIDIEGITKIGIFVAIIYSLSAIFTYIEGYIMADVTQKISKSLRTSVSKKINRLPLRYFDSTSHGQILSRVTNDVDTISQSMNQSVVVLITSVVMFLGTLIMMFITNVIMAITAILSTIIGFLFMTIIIAKSQKHFKTQQKELASINGHIEEIYTGHNIVKAYNGEEKAKKVFKEINDKLYNSVWKSQFLSGLMMPLMMFIGNFGYVAVCVVGAALVSSEQISFGVIVAFIAYVRLFTYPLSQIAQSATSLQSTAAASEHVFELLDQNELDDESHKTTTIKNAKGNIEFKNVKFGYSKDKTIINNFSAKISAGQKVAIVGPTGAGKTTIVNLLMRFYEIDSGEIRIDGVPSTHLTRENIHELFCMVLQDTWLFEGTIKENIAYSKQNVKDEEIIEACKNVGIDHFIRTLPHGYDTVLDDKTNLSAGQKQLITIARAMVENAPLLILDEATSSVDTRTEILIQNAMDKLTIGRTSFVIAHRLSTIKNANIILVMKDGDIIESGNHEELLAQNGFYSELYNSQFENVS